MNHQDAVFSGFTFRVRTCRVWKEFRVGLLAGVLGISGATAQEAAFFSDRLLVKPAVGVHEAVLNQILAGEQAVETARIDPIDVRVIHVPAVRMQIVLEALRRNPNIAFAEPDYLVPPDATVNDPIYASQWHLPKIAAPIGWDTTIGDGSVIVAILDTGVDAQHPDLSGRLVTGRNIYDNNADTTDVHGHGTKVAGTAVAAGNNGIGVAGVAFGCRLMPIRISTLTGSASSSAAASGLIWAADHGARVANISYSMTPYSVVADAAGYFRSKGGVVTVSAGNDGALLSTADRSTILTVSATDSGDGLASWSNRGPMVDLSAPGTGIYTTTQGGGYGAASGTSFSAPVVAGVAALILSANPGLSAEGVEGALELGAIDLGSAGWDSSYGWGRVDVPRALAAAGGTGSPGPVDEENLPPTIQIVSPADGSSVTKSSSTVTVATQDDVGVTKVELWVDGKLESIATSPPYSTRWNVRKAARGWHQLQCVALDAEGGMGTSQIVLVIK